MECSHDLTEREIAVTADGMCPLCMKKKIDELEGKKKTWFEKMVDEQKGTPLFEAEGKILELEEENYKLKKKIEELDTAFNITTGALEGSQGVIKELHEEVDMWVQHCVDANREVDKKKVQIGELETKLALHDKSQYMMVHKQFLKELEGRLEDQSARIGSLEDEVDHLRYKERREEE